MRTIQETRATCAACGNVWHYGKIDEMDATSDQLHNAGRAMMCCSGCLPALLIPERKPAELGKCAKCGSTAVTKETVEHTVP